MRWLEDHGGPLLVVLVSAACAAVIYYRGW